MTRNVYYAPENVDAFAAAWLLWLRFGDEDTTYEPYIDGCLAKPMGREIFVIGVGMPKAQIEDLKSSATGVSIFLSQNEGDRKELKALADSLGYVTYKDGRCLAYQMWEWMLGNGPIPSGIADRPGFIPELQDHICGPKSRSTSEAVTASLSAHPRKFPMWTSMVNGIGLGEHIQSGKAILKHLHRECEDTVRRAEAFMHGVYCGAAANCTTSVVAPKVAVALSDAAEFGMAYYRKMGRWNYVAVCEPGKLNLLEVFKGFDPSGCDHNVTFTSLDLIVGSKKKPTTDTKKKAIDPPPKEAAGATK